MRDLLDDARPDAPAAGDEQAPQPVVPRTIVRWRGGRSEVVEAGVIGEIRFTINVDGAELVTMMCSPWTLRALVLGFLYLEGLIRSVDDVALLRVCAEDRLAEVRLRGERPAVLPAHRILTSGCGGGTSFGQYLAEVDRFRLADGQAVSPGHLYAMMRRLYERASLYRRARGCHTSVLADERGVLVAAEDIGRHNTLDKIQGLCLLEGIETRGTILLSSGRISSEMLLKAAVMGIPIVCSRTSPTALAVGLAERLNITAVGYIRQDTLNVYSHPWRVCG